MENIYKDPLPECSFTSSGKIVPVQQEKDTLITVENVELNDPAIDFPCKPEKPSDTDDLPCKPVKPSDTDDLPCKPEKPSDTDDLPCKPEKPSDTDDLPCKPDKPSDTDDLPCKPDKPSDTDDLPCKPDKPSDSDCCGSGCIPCVFDIYDQEIQIWERDCSRLRNKALSGQDNLYKEKSMLSELEYIKFTISQVWPETGDTNRYRFKLPFDRDLGLQIGQHIIVRGRILNETITRQYTPITDITTSGYFDLLIKIYRDGKMSKIIRDWKVGDEVEIRGPFGSLEYIPGKEQEKNYQYGDKVCERRIDETLIQQEISGKTMDKFMILICGTRSFDEDIIKCCDNLGFNQKQIFKF